MVSDLMAAARTDPLTGLRNLRGWDEALDHELAAAARDGRNMVPPMLAACRAEATLGEICDLLREEWGEYTEPARF